MKRKFITTLAIIAFCAQAGLYAADIIAAPNPWVPEGGRTATGTMAGGITFRNLPSEGEFFIYTLSGDLVTKQQLDNGSGTLNWNGKNDSNADTASGVYFWVVRSPEATKSGKLIIIR